MNLVVLGILGVAVGFQFGWLVGVAAVCAVWLLMPYEYVGRRQ